MINLFYIGQKVVNIHEYVNDPVNPGYSGNQFPIYGQVYTIREFCLDVDEHPEIYPEDQRDIGLKLEEIVNPELQCAPDGRLGEIAFPGRFFRPLNEQDIWNNKRIKELV